MVARSEICVRLGDVGDMEGGFEKGEGEVGWQATTRMARMRTVNSSWKIFLKRLFVSK